MYIRKKQSSHNSNYVKVQIVEGVRKDSGVHQTILRHVGTAHNKDELEQLMFLAESIKTRMEEERKPALPLFAPEDLIRDRMEERQKEIEKEEELNVNLKKCREEQRINEGIPQVCGKLFDDLEYGKIFKGRNASTLSATLKACVLARVANPGSKTRTAEFVEKDFGIKLPVDRIYRMMDQLEKIEERVKDFVTNASLSVLGKKVNILLYDVTTLYFESFTEDELRRFGFSKDCKFKEVQIVLVMITTPEGLPISFEVFPGNTSEINTLLPSINTLKERFNIDKIEFAADRALFSKNNLDLLDEHKIQYVIAAKLKNMGAKVKEEILKVKEGDLSKVLTKELNYKGRRLIINYSPSRAAKDKKDRDRLVERLEKKADKDGKVKLKNIIKNNGTKKYLICEKEQTIFGKVDYTKIDREEAWDGIHGVITNSQELTSQQANEKYHNLWVIEETFRINKHDLRVRPIFHRAGNRILSHLLICFLSYSLARQLMYRSKLQYERLSFEEIRNQLLSVQASVLKNTLTKDRYLVPSRTTLTASKLYQIVGLKRSVVPYKL